MDDEDPLKRIIIRILIAVLSAVTIVTFLKPNLVLAATFATCISCGDYGSLFLAIVFMGAIGIAMYKFMGIFNNG